MKKKKQTKFKSVDELVKKTMPKSVQDKYFSTYVFNHIFVQGDWHGKWNMVLEEIEKLPNDSLLICVGDVGLGFRGLTLNRLCVGLEPILAKKAITLFLLRGNHDNPAIWKEETHSDYIKLIEDFSEIRINNKNFYFIGGATSIDRSYRTKNVDYWVDEVIPYNDYVKPINKIDVLITHSAPLFCWPVGFNDYCRYWFKEEPILEQELTKERQFLNKVFDDIKPELHVYGHFHSSVNEIMDKCKHILLNELEIKEIT